MTRRIIAIIALVGLLFGGRHIAFFAHAEGSAALVTEPIGAYWTYIREHETYPGHTQSVPADLASAVVRSGEASWNAAEQAWEVGELSEIEYRLRVPESGLYYLRMDYMSTETSGSEILRTILINGAMPYDEAREVKLRRLYRDGEQKKDVNGNDIRPTQMEVQMRQSVLLQDYMGYVTEPLQFYLNEGENTVTVVAASSPCRLYGLAAEPVRPKMKYAENIMGAKTEADPILVQGEDATYKTSPMLYPSIDRVTADTLPSSPTLQLLNVIGGRSWIEPNQAIIWDFNVEKTGDYTLSFRVRQNITRNMISMRDVYVDGSIIYEGMHNWSVSFDSDWQYITLTDEKGVPLCFHLEKGTHQVEMVAVLGEKANKISIINDQVQALNELYVQIMIITGSTPDAYRDYRLDKLIPEELAKIPPIAEKIRQIRDWYLDYYGSNTSANSILDTVIRQLKGFVEDSEKIAKEFSSFKSNISALAEWTVQARQQPLEVDFFVFNPVNGNTYAVQEANLWERFKFGLMRFLYSFIEDYSAVGVSNGAEAITVWVPTGRDQAQVIKKLIDSSFTPKTGIPVNLKLVSGALLPATVAGRAPDVSLMNGDGNAVNYGMRSAVMDLSVFPDFEEVTLRFLPQRMTPYYYGDSCFALPETQSFAVMFYRKDILEMLGIPVPTTWVELVSAITVLQKNNMGFAMPVGSGAYYWLLYQQGGSIYNENGTKTIIDSDEGVAAFRFWTNLYKNYELPLSYNFLSRFRTGEYPIIIEDFTNANTLSLSAPEIRGLWGFAPVPGTERADGTVDNSVTVGGSCSLMLKSTQHPEESWEFMKWWTSADTQTAYGREMESILGASARYNSANIESFKRTAWTIEQRTILNSQLPKTKGVPQIPGGYFMDRHLNNAFRKVLYKNGDPQDVIYDYVYTINQEIRSKREEFGLEVE